MRDAKLGVATGRYRSGRARRGRVALDQPGTLVARQLIDAVATARIVRLIQTDSITAPLRSRLLDLAYDHKADRVTELMQCSWCLSVWVGFGLVALRLAAPRLHAVTVAGLASSQLAAMLIDWTDSRQTEESAITPN